MGQVLIRNLDDGLLAEYRQAAARRNSRSLEAESPFALERGKPVSPGHRDTLIGLSRRFRALTPAGVEQTPSEALLGEDRDGFRGE